MIQKDNNWLREKLSGDLERISQTVCRFLVEKRPEAPDWIERGAWAVSEEVLEDRRPPILYEDLLQHLWVRAFTNYDKMRENKPGYIIAIRTYVLQRVLWDMRDYLQKVISYYYPDTYLIEIKERYETDEDSAVWLKYLNSGEGLIKTDLDLGDRYLLFLRFHMGMNIKEIAKTTFRTSNHMLAKMDSLVETIKEDNHV